jgi:hypothetical protein
VKGKPMYHKAIALASPADVAIGTERREGVDQ